MKWFPKKALLFLDISKPNFEKKNRGKKASKYHSIHVNKRLLCVKASRGIWSHWQDQGYHSHNKIDLHNLGQRGLDWGDTLSDEFRPIWTSRFEIIKETMKNCSSNAFNIEYLKYSFEYLVNIWLFILKCKGSMVCAWLIMIQVG